MNNKEVEQYLRKVQWLLNLNHWDIAVKFNDLDEWFIWHNNCKYNYCKATIEFDNDYIRNSNDEQNKKNIIHELLHCHFWYNRFLLNNTKETVSDWVSTYDELCNNAGVIRILGILDWWLNNAGVMEEQSVELLSRAIYNLIENNAN